MLSLGIRAHKHFDHKMLRGETASTQLTLPSPVCIEHCVGSVLPVAQDSFVRGRWPLSDNIAESRDGQEPKKAPARGKVPNNGSVRCLQPQFSISTKWIPTRYAFRPHQRVRHAEDLEERVYECVQDARLVVNATSNATRRTQYAVHARNRLASACTRNDDRKLFGRRPRKGRAMQSHPIPHRSEMVMCQVVHPEQLMSTPEAHLDKGLGQNSTESTRSRHTMPSLNFFHLVRPVP